MRRTELEHVIRVVGALVRDNDLYVLGSQAILGAFPDAPIELLGSLEADVYPRNSPLGAVLVDDALGERSAFHQTYGYYAHAVAPAILYFAGGLGKPPDPCEKPVHWRSDGVVPGAA